jgi:CubicO group peptidase (beta-lactamase class C family)
MNKKQNAIILLLAVFSLSGKLTAGELPRLPEELVPENQTSSEQRNLPDLPEAYVNTSPVDLGDGLHVGTLDLPGAEEAVKALVADDKEGKYSNLDSILIWKDGKLLFEMYNRRGRVDGPHYTMSITKTMTSVTLARAIQVGLLDMEDLDKPVIDFMPEIDRSKIQPGVDTITIRDALHMKSGLRFSEKNIARTLGSKYSKQQYFQKLFENTAPITPESKEYKYTGTNPEMILMILDSRAPGTIQEFIAKEVAGKFGATYCWNDQSFGIPSGGAGSSFTSRDLMKFGTAVIQGGKFNGEQLLSADYVAQVIAPKDKKGYYFYFHDRPEKCAGKSLRFNSGVGAGGQYMGTLPELNMVLVATAHNKKAIGLPLNAIMEHLVPLFID